MQLYVPYRAAAGVSSDFERLLKKFINTGTVRYEDFAKVWREMKMSYIYAGRDLERELKEFIEECMAIAVKLFLPPYQFETRVGGLYILYALFNTQPFSPKVKIRVTLEQWTEMIDFHSLVKSQSHYDISFIFVRLRLDGAFTFVAMPTELQPEFVGHPGEMPALEVGKPLEVLPAEAAEQLQAVHDQYWKMKCALAGPYAHAPDPALDVIESNIVGDVAKTIKEYEDLAKHRLADEASGRANRASVAEAFGSGDSGSDSDKPKRAAAGKAKARRNGASALVGGSEAAARGRGGTSRAPAGGRGSRGGLGRGHSRPSTSAGTAPAAPAAAAAAAAAAEVEDSLQVVDGSDTAEEGRSSDDPAAERLRGGSRGARKSRRRPEPRASKLTQPQRSTPARKQASVAGKLKSAAKRRRRRRYSGSSSDSDADNFSVHDMSDDSEEEEEEGFGKRKAKRTSTRPMAAVQSRHAVRGRPPTHGRRSASSSVRPAASSSQGDAKAAGADATGERAAVSEPGDDGGESVGTDEPTFILDMPQLL